jgi:hypothetical protein
VSGCFAALVTIDPGCLDKIFGKNRKKTMKQLRHPAINPKANWSFSFIVVPVLLNNPSFYTEENDGLFPKYTLEVKTRLQFLVPRLISSVPKKWQFEIREE